MEARENDPAQGQGPDDSTEPIVEHIEGQTRRVPSHSVVRWVQGVHDGDAASDGSGPEETDQDLRVMEN